MQRAVWDLDHDLYRRVDVVVIRSVGPDEKGDYRAVAGVSPRARRAVTREDRILAGELLIDVVGREPPGPKRLVQPGLRIYSCPKSTLLGQVLG